MQDNEWFCLKSDVYYVAVGIYFMRNETNALLYRILEPICQLSSSPLPWVHQHQYLQTQHGMILDICILFF